VVIEEAMVVEEALALCIVVEIDVVVAFLFLFSAANSVRACITGISFRN
jgi:hypothetical protein